MLDPPSPTDSDSLVGIQEAHASYNARQTKRAPAEADTLASFKNVAAASPRSDLALYWE
jgi:hypothetical protein